MSNRWPFVKEINGILFAFNISPMYSVQKPCIYSKYLALANRIDRKQMLHEYLIMIYTVRLKSSRFWIYDQIGNGLAESPEHVW